MKKLLYTIASLAALTAIACTKEQGTPEVRPEIPDTPEEVIEVPATLSGSMGDPTTKVSNDNNGAYKWQASDHVTILTNNGANREFTADEAGLTTEFSGHIPNLDKLIDGFALYPASEDHYSVSKTTINFNIPTTLTWGADASYMPMYAPIGVDPEDAEKVKASFKAVGGTMKLICYNIPEGATTLAFTAKVKIAGNFTLDTTAETPTLSGEGTTGKEIDIDFTGNYSANKVFYIPLPPVTLTDGFTITIFDSEEKKLFEKSTTAAPTIARNHLVIAPALNCNPAPADDELTNAAIVASEDLTNSYSSGTIGEWSFNACKQTYNTVVYIQIRNNSTVSYIKVPEYSNEIASVVLHDVRNGAGDAYVNTIYFRSSANNSATPITSADPTLSAGDDYELSIPEGHTTGYIMSSNPLRCASITVKFRGADIPVITVGSDALTINVGSSNASTTASLANAVDGLGINWKFSGTNADKFEASLDGTTLTVTAKETNSSASDYTATLTLKASGAVSKEIAITQKTKLVPNPAVTVTPGDSKFTATWTADENATSYVAYLHTATTATPETGGTTINPTNSGSAYSITDYAVTNGTTYYLYVKVNGVSSGYSAPSDYVEYSFKPVLWDLKSIAVTTAPKTTYTAGECFDPTGMVVTATFENHDNTEQTKQETVDNANLTFEPSTSTALTTSDESVTIGYTVSGINKTTTQTITVNPDTSNHYQKVTSLSNVTAGEYIIVSNNTYLPNASTSSAPAALAVTISNNEVQNVTDAMTWTFTGTTSGMTIKSTVSGTPYLYTTAGNNGVRVGTTSGTWTIADNSSGFSLKFNETNRYCATTSNNGGDWRSYDSPTSQYYLDSGQVYLYKLVDNTVWDLNSITAVKTAPTKTAYEAGEYFDPTGLVITATYKDHDGIKADKTEDVAYSNANASQFSFSPSTSTALTTSDVSVTISYTENGITKTVSQAITVTAPVVWDLKSIAVTTAPTKTTYTEGEFFDPTGLVVTPTFEEHGNTSNTKVGDPVDNANLTFTPSTSTALTTSDVSVTIGYTVSGINKTTTQTITVNADSGNHYQKVTSLSNVTAGEYIIVNGGFYLPNTTATNACPAKLAVTISNDEVQNVTSAMTWTFTGTTNAMTIKSTADATKYLYVSGNGNDKIRVNTTSATWTIGNYSGTSGAFTMKDNTQNRYCATYGDGTDWRSYNSYNATNYADGGRVYLYKLVDNTVWDLKSIAVTTPPTKTTYDVGDNFDPTGMVVTATYEDHAGVKADKEETVAHGDLTFSPALNAALTAGTTSVSISYGGQSTSQAITVIEWTLNSITVKTAPTKVSYTAGQNFDPAGLVITATYTADGQSDKNVDVEYSNETAAAFTFSPTTSTDLTTDHSSVSITWGGKTTSQAITVNEAGGSGYTLTLSSGSLGSITATVDNATVSSGSKVAPDKTVTISVTPNTGCAFISLKYNDGSDHDITSGKSFTMPSSDVTVTAVFAHKYSLTPNQSSTGSSATTYIISLTSFTYSQIEWQMNQWNPSNLQVKANQSNPASEFRFYNSSAFSGRIVKVVITFKALNVSDASKLMFKGGATAVTTTTGGTAGTWNSTDKTLTWTPGASDNFTYFAFYQNGKAASGNNYLESSDAIVVYYE